MHNQNQGSPTQSTVGMQQQGNNKIIPTTTTPMPSVVPSTRPNSRDSTRSAANKNNYNRSEHIRWEQGPTQILKSIGLITIKIKSPETNKDKPCIAYSRINQSQVSHSPRRLSCFKSTSKFNNTLSTPPLIYKSPSECSYTPSRITPTGLLKISTSLSH